MRSFYRLYSHNKYTSQLKEATSEPMKADRAHRVPLSEGVIKLLKVQKKNSSSHLIFTSYKNTELSDATLNATIKRVHQGKLDRK